MNRAGREELDTYTLDTQLIRNPPRYLESVILRPKLGQLSPHLFRKKKLLQPVVAKVLFWGELDTRALSSLQLT